MQCVYRNLGPNRFIVNSRRKPFSQKTRFGSTARRRTGSFHSRPLQAKSDELQYLVLNKPFQVLTRFTDDQGRSTLADYIDLPHVYPVGRLDFDSEGLLILTNDGPLSHRLTDPKFDHAKTYLAQVEHQPNEESLDQLRQGLILSDGPCKPVDVECLESEPVPWERSVPIRFRKTVPTVWLKLTLREGRNRQVRRMTAAIGHPCLRLVRWSMGPVTVDDLQPGQWRVLTDLEVADLKKIRDAKRR